MVDTRDKSPLLPIGGKSLITASSSRLFCLHMTIAILSFFCFSLIAAFVVTSKTRCYIVIPPITTTDNTIYNITTPTKTTTFSFVPLDPLALPSVAIIGTPKGGTTDLQNQIISRWSEIMIRPVTKELRDLADWKGISTLIGSLNHQMYAERLNHPCAAAINSTTESFIQCSLNNRGKFTIDADPSYLENPAIPLSLRSISPTTKIIILLRDPVSRAESLLNQWATRCTDPKVLQSSAFCTTPIDEYATDFIDQMVANHTVSFRFNLLLDSIADTNDSDIKTALLYSEIVEAGLLDWGSRKLFTSSLYAYSLATWNLHFFRPGRVLIIDSHIYFTKRNMVMDRVSRFLFDKPLVDDDDDDDSGEKEDVMNRKWGSYRNNTRLSEGMKAKLVEFYRPHTMKLLDELLPRMRMRSGVELVGFESDTRGEWLG